MTPQLTATAFSWTGLVFSGVIATMMQSNSQPEAGEYRNVGRGRAGEYRNVGRGREGDASYKLVDMQGKLSAVGPSKASQL